MSEQFDFEFETLLDQLPFKIFSTKGNAVRALRGKCIDGVDYIEVQEGKKYHYYLSAQGVRKIFFNQNSETFDIFAQLLEEKNKRIAQLETELDSYTISLDRKTKIVNIANLEKVPLPILLKKYGRNAIKKFLSTSLDGLTRKEMVILKASWDKLAEYCDQIPELRQPLLSLLGYFFNPFLLQREMEKYFEEKENYPMSKEELQEKRRKMREAKAAYRRRKKERELMQG